MRKPLIVLVAVLALAGVACSKDSVSTSTTAAPTPAGSPSPARSDYVGLADEKAPSGKEPSVFIPTDKEAPTALQVTDLTVGAGAEAQSTSTIEVNYLLLTWEGGQKVASSFGAQPLVSPLSGLIPGWKQGLLGMKVGGRRQLIIPPDLAYGPASGGHQLGGKTLIFIVDLLKVS